MLRAPAAATVPMRIPSPALVFGAIRVNPLENNELKFASKGIGRIIQNLACTAPSVLI